jgi:hypothetical protein
MGWHFLHGPLVRVRSQGKLSHLMWLKSVRLGYTKASQRSVAQCCQRGLLGFPGAVIPLEPILITLVGGIAVVFGRFALKFQNNVALLFTVCGPGFNRIELLAVTERHLNAEGAIG